MIALLLAAALNLFTLVAPPAGTDIVSTFALNSFTTDTQGIRTVTTAAPTLSQNVEGLAVDLSFISPVKGECIVGDVVYVNGDPRIFLLGQSPVNKNATVIVSLPLPSQLDIVRVGGSPDGYTVFAACDADSDTDQSKAVFSNFYHINAAPTKPA